MSRPTLGDRARRDSSSYEAAVLRAAGGRYRARRRLGRWESLVRFYLRLWQRDR